MKRQQFRILSTMVLSLSLVACSKPAAPPEPERIVRTVVVAPASAGGSQEYAGEIRARSEVRLGFRVAGKMTSRQAEVGQRVKAGEVLARLDPEDLRLSQEAARAGVQSAQVNLDFNQADFKRFKELRDQGFISGAELERREATLKSAAALLDQAKANASVQINQSAYTTLVATAAGVIVGVDAEPGAVLAAGAPVLRMALDGPRDVVFSVPENGVAAVKPLLGKAGALGVELWGSKDRLRATVREIAAAADPVTRTYQVKADLVAPLQQLGQTATVFIELPRIEAVTLLPLSAVKESQGRSVVWVVDAIKMSVSIRPIEVAGAQGNEVVVNAGLKPGDVVVTAGVHVLTQGQKVRLQAVDPASAARATAARPASATLR